MFLNGLANWHGCHFYTTFKSAISGANKVRHDCHGNKRVRAHWYSSHWYSNTMVDSPHGKGVTFTIRSAPVGYAAEYLTCGTFPAIPMGSFPLMFIYCILYHFWDVRRILLPPLPNQSPPRQIRRELANHLSSFLSQFYTLYTANWAPIVNMTEVSK